jgi:hypothetical protein
LENPVLARDAICHKGGRILIQSESILGLTIVASISSVLQKVARGCEKIDFGGPFKL